MKFIGTKIPNEDEINMHKMALVELRNDLLNGR